MRAVRYSVEFFFRLRYPVAGMGAIDEAQGPLVGLRVPGVAIRDPGCTEKTYPGYFDDLAAAIGRSN